MPTCWIIAGPNGAGKTTFALRYLPRGVKCNNFINADLIAMGLSPLAPERGILAASKIFLQEIEDCVIRREDFSFETTLSGRGNLELINRLRSSGWQVELIYLALPNKEMSKMRVAERVAHGGHNIPLKDIERRFSRSLNNLLMLFCNAVDRCICYMNDAEDPVPIFEQKGEKRQIHHYLYFQQIMREAGL